MSIPSSTAPSGQSYQEMWSTMVPYLAPPIAAGIAVIPVYRGFEIKTEQQLRPLHAQSERTFLKQILKEMTPTSIKEALKRGCKEAPIISVIIGTQMVTQSLCEKGLKTLKPKAHGNQDENFALILLSAMIVGVASAPALAVFNGGTMGRTWEESLRALSIKQTCAIVSRETSFLFSLRISGPVADYMERTYGKNKAVEYGSTFATGAIGSLIGHPADTALTLWQKGRDVERLSQTMRGG